MFSCVVWLLTRPQQREAYTHRRGSDCSPKPQPMEWLPPRAPTPIQRVLPPAQDRPSLLSCPCQPPTTRKIFADPKVGGSKVQDQEQNRTDPGAPGERRGETASRHHGGKPAWRQRCRGGDVQSRSPGPRRIQVTLRKQRAEALGQGKEGQGVCSCSCVCVCVQQCVAMRSATCAQYSPTYLGWIGAGVRSMCR